MEFKSGDESAVYSINTPMMVEASAGSGKTTLLVDKYIAMLIYLTAFQNKSAFDAVKEITALTFTRKAAEEMKDRIRKKIGKNFTPSYLDYAAGMINIHERGGPVPAAGMTAAILAQKEALLGAISSASISTIHSFALNILKAHPVETLLDPASSPRGDGISGGDVFITARDALYSSLRKQIDKGSPDLSALIGILGYEKTEDMLEALLKAADTYGYNAVMEMAAGGGYLEYKDGISEQEWLSEKVKPGLRALLSGLEAVRPDVGKTGLPALEKTIREIESAILKDSAPDIFNANFYYPGGSVPVKAVSDGLYARVYSEMHRYVFQYLWRVFGLVFTGYGNLKRERKEISFSDIELILLETLKKDKDFTAGVKKNRRYILIDEYQDTSDIQKEIFDALIYDENGGLSMIPFIVGDPKQSIYGFRNANIEIFGKTKQELLKFRERYHAPVYLDLDRNFRSCKKLVDDFNEIFADIFDNEKTEYRPSVACGPSVTAGSGAGAAGAEGRGAEGVYFVRSEGKHADEIMASASRKAACLIAGLVGSLGYRPGEILVLVRKKTRLPLLRECFDDILGRRGIPYFHVDSSNILDTKEIQDVIIYLQALENPHSNYYFLPLLKSPFFRKSDPEIITLLSKGQSLYDALNSAGTSDEMELFNRIRLKKNRVSIADLAGEIIERSGYFSFLSSLPCKKEATTNVLVFSDYLRRLQEMEMFNLTDFLYYMQEYGVSLSKPSVIGEKSDVVRVMTVHSSKGLESRAVIYLASSPGAGDPGAIIFSGRGAKAGMGMKLVKPDVNYCAFAEDLKNAGAREEKRLAYVTFTRARELFYYIGIDGNDGWKSFINTGKGFAAKRSAVVDEFLQEPVPLTDDKQTAFRAEKQYRLLKSKPVTDDYYFSIPRVITVTQLLDMEFLEKAFKMRYIEKSFPVDEALREIASSEEILARGAAAAEEGTFLHRVFQTASKENYREFIDSALSMEGGGLEKDRGKLIDAARTFYTSGFYGKYYGEGYERKTEWEINFNFMFGQRPVLIKAVLDLYLRGKDGTGIIADFKLKYNSESARYARQLNYYAYFLNKLGYPADELYIYDISGGGESRVPKDTGPLYEIIRKNLEGIRDVYRQVLD